MDAAVERYCSPNQAVVDSGDPWGQGRGMTRHLYWHAPLWEVLLVVVISLAFVGWLVIRALRRPDLQAVLSGIHPGLGDQPLFFFNRIKGIMPLNDAAKQILGTLAASQQPMLDALSETLYEASEEARVIRQQHWPQSDCTLIAVPVSIRTGEVVGVLALVTVEQPLPPAEHPIDERLESEAKAWLTVSPALRLHNARPVVHVKRCAPTAAATWQEHHLSHSEDVLLRHLLWNQGKVQTPETLFRLIWPDDKVEGYGLRPDQQDRLRRLIYQLRQHVEPDPRNPRQVCTAHGVGYVFYLEQEPKTR